MPPEVAIFRHNLFKISETFITQQAERLNRYRPLYLGRMRHGAAPAGAASAALQDLGGPSRLPRILWQMLSRDPRPYQAVLNGRRPALIHAHFGVEGVYALPLAQRLCIPLVTTFHGFDATASTRTLLASPAWANYPLFRHRLARRGHLFLCASSFIRERVLGLGFPPARTRVHHIGVDVRAIQPRDRREEQPEILHVARLVPVKGTEFLIRAFARLAPRHPDATLAIIGDGPLQAPLQTLARSLRMDGRIRFLGPLPHGEVLARMRRAAMLVLPSVRAVDGRVEGLGMVLLEAAASGIPVIGSRSGGIPEAVIEGETGLLVPERDPVALATAISHLLGDAPARHGMGVKARTMVERRFDLHAQTAVLETFYDAVLSGQMI